MNFFGHATVACRRTRDPRFVLGAMLPDFASMSRCRLIGAADPVVSAGISHHHRTDDVFHRAEVFVAVSEACTGALERGGVGRGPARAVGHVGTELVLDGLLLDEPLTRGAYLEAIALGPAASLEVRGDPARFAVLLDRVAEHGIPDDYRHPDRIAVRLERILAGRPRLALDPQHRELVASALERARDALTPRLADLFSELERGLADDTSYTKHLPWAPLVDTPRPPRAILRGR